MSIWSNAIGDYLLATLIAMTLTYALLTLMIRWGAWLRLLDVANGRSSHQQTVVRGGGLAVLLAWLPSLYVVLRRNDISILLPPHLVVGVFIFIILGLCDDIFSLRVWTKLVWQSIAAMLLVASFSFSVPTTLLALLISIWFVNIYNFMDGIDALASLEFLFVMAAAFLLAQDRMPLPIQGSAGLLGLTYLVFLRFNWPPAKIFLGDVGSYFCAVMLLCLMFYTCREKLLYWHTWAILLGVFIVDTSVTLLRRFLSAQCWYRAHCTHAYQHAARRFSCHRKVSVSVFLLNTVWLFPWALASVRYPDLGSVFLLLSWAPLAALSLFFGAGLPDGSTSRWLCKPRDSSI